LIPAFKEAGASLHTISSAGGANAFLQGRSGGFNYATSDSESLIQDPSINTVVIATRHNSHAELAARALEAGKHVFVEKPLALNFVELDRVRAAHAQSGRQLMVGFNRRFAPQIETIKALLAPLTAPKSFIMVMNAGALPEDHWTHDEVLGGGRIIGEACHYIDLMRFLAGAPIVSVQARRMGETDAEAVFEDKAVILLGFADGSFGSIHYLANGGAAFPKERIEVFTAGRSLQLDNFRKLRGFNWPGFKKHNLWRQDKGQSACVTAFIKSLQGGGEPVIPFEELFEVAKVTLEAAEILRAQA
jgi:predicted dehydrogenase